MREGGIMEIKSYAIIALAVLIGIFSIIPFGEKMEFRVRSAWLKAANGIKWVSLKTIGVATCVFMALSYMFAFTNGMLLFDASFIYRGLNFRPTVLSDKWFSPFLSILDMGINMPWFAGVWATAFLILSIYCIADILDIQKKVSLWLVSGLCVTNSSMICQQEYTGGNYTGVVALLFACLAAWFAIKSKDHILYIGGSVIFVAFSAATYGAYVSVAPCLVIMKVLIDICRGKTAKENWKNSFLYCLEFVLGMFLYYLILRLEMHMLGLEIQGYMGESSLSDASVISDMLSWIPEAYKDIVIYYIGGEALAKGRLFLPAYITNIMTVAFVVGIIISILCLKVKYSQIVEKKYNVPLMGVLIVILPIVINLIYVMSQGGVHFLMIFTYVMPFLFFVKEIEYLSGICTNRGMPFKRLNVVFSILLSVFIFNSIILSNAIFSSYYGFWIEAQSIGTRLLDRIENCEGFEGTEKVIIIGAMQGDSYYGEPGTDINLLDAMVGPANLSNVNALNWGSWVKRFLSNILGSNMEYVVYKKMNDYITTEQLDTEEQQVLEEMGYFPRNNSVRKIGDAIYVRFPDE
jgi:hypothetical protein